MPSVGTAYVNIRISTKSFTSQLEGLMARLSKQMDAAGTKLGKDLENGLKRTDPFKPLSDSASKAADSIAKDTQRISDSSDKMNLNISSGADMGKQGLADLRGEFSSTEGEMRKLSAEAGGATRSLRGIGSGGGGGLRNLASDAGFFGRQLDDIAKKGEGARKIVDHFFSLAAFGGNALAGLVGGASAAAQGIFAVGANAAAAAPALAVFADGLIGLAQIGGTVGLAMGGVGKALTAGFTSLDKTALGATAATTGLGNATAAAARAVRDAKESLQNAYRDAARAAEDAARRTADAERALASAQRDTAQAQKDLNAARAEGLQQLKEIAFAAEEASLGEQEAALNLQDAQDQLAATSDLAPDDSARVRAVLDFKEAELAYREAKNSRQQADKDQAKAAKEGVKGTDAYTSAQDNLTQAQQAQADAVQALADARREEARTAQDNAQKIADAQQALADAQGRLADAQKQGTTQMKAATTAADAYKLALSKLSPEQRRFVTRLVNMRDEFYKARREIANPLFAGLNDALTTLLQGNMLPRVGDQLQVTSTHLGQFARDAADLTDDPIFQDAFVRVLRSNNNNMDLWGDTLLNLADAFVQVADAARPLTRRFSIWLDDVSKTWSETTRAKNATGELTKTFNTAGDRVSEFWDLTKQLWRTLRLLGGAANDAANQFEFMNSEGQKQKGYIPSLTDSLNEFNDALEKPAKRRKLIEGFTQALKNMNAVGRAIKNVTDPLIALGQDPNIEKAFNRISQTDAFDRMGKSAGKALPDFADAVSNLLDVVATFSESGSMDTFIWWFDQFSKVAKFVVENVPPPVIKALGLAFGTWRALRFLGSGLKAVTGFAFGDIRKIPGQLKGIQPKILAAGGEIEASGARIAAGFGESFLTGMKAVAGEAGGAAVNIKNRFKTALGGNAQSKLLGEQWIAGIALGIEAGIAGLAEASAAAGNAAKVALKDVLGIRSPSTVGMSVGRDLMLGVTLGIEEGEPGAVAAATGAGAATGAAVGAGAEGSALASAGRFSGVLGKFGRFAGPASKLMKPLSLGIRGIGAAFRFAMGPVGMIILTLLPILWPLLVKLEEKTGIFSKSLKVLTDAFTWLWDKAQPVIQALGDAIGWFWDKVKVTFNWIKNHWDLLLAILTGPIGLAVRFIIRHWGTIVDFVKGLPAKFHRFLDRLWKPVEDRLRDAWTAIQRVWATITDWVKGRPEQFRKNLAALWNILHTGLQDAFVAIKDFWTQHVWPWITGLPGKVASGLKNIFLGLANGFVSAINWIGGKFEKYLFGPLNSVLGKFGVDKISINFTPLGHLDSFAQGGPVRGRGGPKSDSILARVSNGEYILPTAATKKLGRQNLDFMRRTGELPTGGLFGSIVEKARNVVSAVKDGAEFALKWVVGKFADQVEGQNIFGDIAVDILRDIAGNIAKFGQHQDAQATIAIGGAYKGPPGGWTYPLTKHVVITQYPNQGHSPSWAVDLGAPMGTGVRAATRGTVVSTISLGNRSYGNYIVLSHAGGVETLYAHLMKFLVKPGQSVKTGQIIALSDDTGGSTGPHLHFEVKPSSDTVAAMRAHGVRLGTGGVVAPSNAGTLALLAEAGHHERVTPLDREGFTPAERAMLERLDASLNGGGGGDTYNVHPAPGMDETALADKVARRVAWNRRRGTGRR